MELEHPCDVFAFSKHCTRAFGNARDAHPSRGEHTRAPISLHYALEATYVAPPVACPGTPGAADGSSDERQEQREDARYRQDGAQIVRGLLLETGRNLRQRNAAEVDEIGAYGRPKERQNYGVIRRYTKATMS